MTHNPKAKTRLSIVLALGVVGCLAQPLAAQDLTADTFWQGHPEFATSQYDPVARALQLGLTPQAVNRIIDRGLGESELCVERSDLSLACTTAVLAMS